MKGKYSAVERSTQVEPIAVFVGDKKFTCHTRYITPAHDRELNKQAMRAGRFDPELYVELYFDAAIDKVEGLTPEIADMMVELNGGERPPTNEDGTISEREFVKFLWVNARPEDFQNQIDRAEKRFLQISKTHREERAKNSEGSSAH